MRTHWIGSWVSVGGGGGVGPVQRALGGVYPLPHPDQLAGTDQRAHQGRRDTFGLPPPGRHDRVSTNNVRNISTRHHSIIASLEASRERKFQLSINIDHFFVFVSVLTTFPPDLSEFCGQLIGRRMDWLKLIGRR